MSALESGIARALDCGCPDALAVIIREFVNAVCEQFQEQRVGVLLVGSASRGELSWHVVGNKTELFSDIEFLIGVERRDQGRQAEVDRRARQITEQADLGEFFHIDYTFIEWSRLPKLDTKFFIFESKTCGIDLCSEEVAPALPLTTRANLNWKELNEILVHRLSSIVHAIPQGIFSTGLSERANQHFALNLAKNTLDITTWLHPYESTTLVAGYGNRVDAWHQTGLAALKLSGFFTETDIQYLQSCVALRHEPSMSVDSRQMLRNTLDMYFRSIRYCKHMNGIAEQSPLSRFNSSAQLFDEYRLRPRLSQAASIVRHWRATGLARLVRNLVGVRRGLAVEICSDLISAAMQWAVDETSARGSLASARRSLNKVIGVPDNGESGFPSQWFSTLAVFSKHQQITQNF